MKHDPLPLEDERVGREVIGAAIEVHRLLGPGFLEKIYERALAYELGLRGLAVQSQHEIQVPYKEILIPRSATGFACRRASHPRTQSRG